MILSSNGTTRSPSQDACFTGMYGEKWRSAKVTAYKYWIIYSADKEADYAIAKRIMRQQRNLAPQVYYEIDFSEWGNKANSHIKKELRNEFAALFSVGPYSAVLYGQATNNECPTPVSSQESG